jgi:hypothetical protein
MSNPYITQYTCNGTIKVFSTVFKVTQSALLNVYLTALDVDASESNDIVNTADYTILYIGTDDTAVAQVVFNTAPDTGSILTITPVPDATQTVDFTQTTQLDLNDLNVAFYQQGIPTNYISNLYTSDSLRYNVNINQSKASEYSLLLPLLDDGGFWRRSGAQMINQGYSDFISDVAGTITSYTNENEEIEIKNQTGDTFPLTGWDEIDVLTLFVYKNGLKLAQVGEYTIVGSNIVLTTPLIITDELLVDRPALKDSTSYMETDGSNFTNDTGTLIAARNLSNIQNAGLLVILDAMFPIGSVFYVGDPAGTPPMQGTLGVTWELQAAGNVIYTDVLTNAGTTSGTNNVTTGTTGTHVLTILEMPEHDHTINTMTPSNVSLNDTSAPVLSTGTTIATDKTGGGEGHTHGLDAKVLSLAIYIRTS